MFTLREDTTGTKVAAFDDVLDLLKVRLYGPTGQPLTALPISLTTENLAYLASQETLAAILLLLSQLWNDQTPAYIANNSNHPLFITGDPSTPAYVANTDQNPLFVTGNSDMPAYDDVTDREDRKLGEVRITGTIDGVWSAIGTSDANTEQTVTVAAHATMKHYISTIDIFVYGGTTATDLIVELRDGATPKWKGVIGTAKSSGERLVFQLPEPIEFTVNTAANLVIPACGAGVISLASIIGWTK